MQGEDTLLSKELIIESKKYYFDLKENANGKFLRITEKRSGGKSRIIIPVSGLNDVAGIVREMGEAVD